MKALVKADFLDLKHDTLRKQGEVLVLTKERFDEINAKLPGWLEKVEDEPEQQAAKPKRASSSKTTKES